MFDSSHCGVVAGIVKDAGVVCDVRTGVSRDVLEGFEDVVKVAALFGCSFGDVSVEDEVDDVSGVGKIVVWFRGGVLDAFWDEHAADTFDERLLVDANVVLSTVVVFSGCL